MVVGRHIPALIFVIGYSVLVGLGTLLCIIPGIIIAIFLFAGYLAIILEKRQIIDALFRSCQLVKGNWFFTLGVVLVGMLASFMPIWIMEGVMATATGGNLLIVAVVVAGVSFAVFPL